ncbi:CU044_5270 family protein [Curtobacterium sp. MCBD17_019]|uniref:CU044_5270 family protein n=1 Tax=Curtobacterium sp. MCBD17_019 TaxID=2175669 RepID=UPI000DA8D6ED|nr:CU044_5270 family protein [Curtobacterium sp. MCBD17_019]PZE75811.1 hypothetical protein DEI82_07900 [Curtobacterium sp. MCBD17_019]
MDELTLLRSVRDDVEPVQPETLARGREALLAHIEQGTSTRGPVRRGSGRRSRRAGWIGAGSVVAAGVAAALVVGNVIGVAGTGPHGSAAPAAAEVLTHAAASTTATTDPVVHPGQYLEVATRAVYASGFEDDHGSGTYLSSQDGQLYVPADTAGDWVWVRDPERVVQTFGPDSERAARVSDKAKGEYLRAAGGGFYGSPAVVSPSDLAALPRDPAALLRHAYDATKGQDDPDLAAFGWIADTLRSGLAPADLRAALYKAAAGIPGVVLTDRQANLEGRTGVAIGYAQGNGDQQELIIDPSTGLLIGEREVVTGGAAASWKVPDGTPIGWTAVTTSVVDAAPARSAR